MVLGHLHAFAAQLPIRWFSVVGLCYACITYRTQEPTIWVTGSKGMVYKSLQNGSTSSTPHRTIYNVSITLDRTSTSSGREVRSQQVLLLHVVRRRWQGHDVAYAGRVLPTSPPEASEGLPARIAGTSWRILQGLL